MQNHYFSYLDYCLKEQEKEDKTAKVNKVSEQGFCLFAGMVTGAKKHARTEKTDSWFISYFFLYQILSKYWFYIPLQYQGNKLGPPAQHIGKGLIKRIGKSDKN